MTPKPLTITVHPAGLKDQLSNRLSQLQQDNFLSRLWSYDHTLWQPTPDEISNRLDWLTLPDSMRSELDEIEAVAAELVREKFQTAVLLGMGGSSLAPEVFARTFGTQPGFLDLVVLDTTDPVAIRNTASGLNFEKTIFIVATKSGGTVETLSLFKYFYNQIAALKAVNPGEYFIAITDPGSKLDKLAAALTFRHTFLNNPSLGGRYSALSHFGLVPAALIGADLSQILFSAAVATKQNQPGQDEGESPALQLGALIGEAALHGRDKLTFITDETLNSFSDWVEQLIAESTGKAGKGILPVVGEPLAANLTNYGSDRLFVLQSVGKSENLRVLSESLHSQGFPVVEVQIQEKSELGGLMLTWEIATAVAGHILGIHPFNQPDVESAKGHARQSVEAYQETGSLPNHKTVPLSNQQLDNFLASTKSGDYISLQAYLPPSQEIEAAFRKMQAKLRDKYHAPVTFGYGPRFLHSTGQLHKGDRGNGHFIQFISTPSADLEIPDEPGQISSTITFNTLKRAQAIGDATALIDKGRPVLSFAFTGEPLSAIRKFTEGI